MNEELEVLKGWPASTVYSRKLVLDQLHEKDRQLSILRRSARK